MGRLWANKTVDTAAPWYPQDNSTFNKLFFFLLYSGISVNDEILSQYNPLFIVNSKTNVR